MRCSRCTAQCQSGSPDANLTCERGGRHLKNTWYSETNLSCFNLVWCLFSQFARLVALKTFPSSGVFQPATFTCLLPTTLTVTAWVPGDFGRRASVAWFLPAVNSCLTSTVVLRHTDQWWFVAKVDVCASFWVRLILLGFRHPQLILRMFKRDTIVPDTLIKETHLKYCVSPRWRRKTSQMKHQQKRTH